MRVGSFLAHLVLLIGILPPAVAQVQQMPVSVTVNSVMGKSQVDTVINVKATIINYTDSSTAAMLSDTAYLRNLSGTYWINNSAAEVVTIKVVPAKTLQISLPGRGEYDLTPIAPVYFDVKGLPGVKILVFIDSFGQSRGIDIIDENEGKGSLKRQVNARKQGQFRN